MPAHDNPSVDTVEPPVSPVPAARADRARPRRRARWARWVGGLLVLVAFGVWAGTLVLESAWGDSRIVEAARVLLAGGDRSASDDLLAIEEPTETEPLPLTGVLPASPDDWVVQGPQHVPGSSGTKIEAYFNPRSDQLTIVTPMMAYVQVSRMDGPADALIEPAARADSRYTSGRGQEFVSGRTVEVGHTEDMRIYFIGWSEGDRVYTVEATYTHIVPATNAITIIRDAAEEVAGIVMGDTGGGEAQ